MEIDELADLIVQRSDSEIQEYISNAGDYLGMAKASSDKMDETIDELAQSIRNTIEQKYIHIDVGIMIMNKE